MIECLGTKRHIFSLNLTPLGLGVEYQNWHNDFEGVYRQRKHHRLHRLQRASRRRCHSLTVATCCVSASSALSPEPPAARSLSLHHHPDGKPPKPYHQQAHSNPLCRAFSILSSTRPSLLPRHATHAPATSSPQSEPNFSSSLDLLPRISTHPSLANTQVRNGPRDTYDPSHRVRKRRHGFLSRVRTRKGKNTLKRRKLKKRSTLSH